MVRWRGVGAWAFGFLLAGCLGSDDEDEDVDPEGPERPRLVDFVIECPPGSTTELVPGICIGTLQSQTESLQEPFAAIDPARDGVAAIGVNGGESAGSGTTDADPLAAPVRLHVYVTEDGGANWRLSRLPEIESPSGSAPTGVSLASDPTLGFDQRGRLHVVGMHSRDIATRGYEIFYTSTDNLGASWRQPFVFTQDENNDRPWLTVAPSGALFLAWHNFVIEAGRVEELVPGVAWSRDGGTTWRQAEPAEESPACRGPVPPMAVLTGQAFLACAGFEGADFRGVMILRLDPDNATFTRVATLPSTYLGPRFLLTAADASLVFVGGNDANLVVARSMDGGVTWTTPLALRDFVTVEDGWRNFIPAMAATDPWGGIHVLARDLNPNTCNENVPTLRDCSRAPIAHVGVRVDDLALLSEELLTPPDPTQPRRSPPSLARAWADDYLGLSFHSAGGLVVWTRDRGLDFTTIGPAWASPPLPGAS